MVPGTDSGQPGGEHGAAADVERLVAHLRDAAPEHVVDDGRVDARALGQRLQDVAGEVDRVHGGQRAPSPPDGRADGFDDDGIAHGGLLAAGLGSAGYWRVASPTIVGAAAAVRPPGEPSRASCSSLVRACAATRQTATTASTATPNAALR